MSTLSPSIQSTGGVAALGLDERFALLVAIEIEVACGSLTDGRLSINDLYAEKLPIQAPSRCAELVELSVMVAPHQRVSASRMSLSKIRLQYLIFPYVDLQIGPPRGVDHFAIGSFTVWKDTPDNWQKYLKCARPTRHLAMYVNREGVPVSSIWIATVDAGRQVESEAWQRLTAALFYLSWARVPFATMDRPGAEDFYSEPFALPDGAEADSATHVRWSKTGPTVWTEMKVYPALEASRHTCQIELPPATPSPVGAFHDPVPAERFLSLEQELTKSESRLLIGLWFFHQACYRSLTRSGYAEDIQNLCSAFEAILDISKKGDSSRQVAAALKKIFLPLSPSSAEAANSKPPGNERPDVLKRLDDWVEALYQVRNEYSHGKIITTFRFGERSIWQDAFEIFRLAADRLIVGAPERKPRNGSLLEKRLMSVAYYDSATAFFSKKDRWMQPKQATSTSIREAIRKACSLDPGLVETISSPSVLRQALFNISGKICRTLLARQEQLDPTSLSVLRALQEAFTASKRTGAVDVDAYLKQALFLFDNWTPVIPIEGTRILLYELVEALKNLRQVHTRFH